jgi:hypothetical protein
MAERVKYLGVTMEATTAEVLARLDAERYVPTSGLWLYAIVRAIPYQQLLIQSDDAYVINWLALASQYSKGLFEVLVDPEVEAPLRALLETSGWDTSFIHTVLYGIGGLSWYDDMEGIRYIGESGRHRPLVGSCYGTKGDDLVIRAADAPLLTTLPEYESVVVGGAWRLYGGRKIPYVTTDREKLVAILVEVLKPNTIALGMNVVFDGKMKPQKSKINFSGTGGQIGQGDVLICHPDDLNRYTPLPGAVALVLGEVTDLVQAFTCALPVGDEVLTIVIK